MTERNFINAVNRQLPRSLHHQSTTGVIGVGTPDRYYDGDPYDLWVEYKYLDAMPRSGLVGGVDAEKRGCYSPVQYRWMERRYRHSLNLPHGPNVVGIVGLPNRTAVIQRSPTEWREGSPITNAIPIKEVSAWIVAFCSPSCASSVPSSRASHRC